MQALVRSLGEGVSDDPQLNLTAPITHMLAGEAEFNRLEKLAKGYRLRFVKVAEHDMPLFYKLAQELNTVIKGRAYINAFTLTTEEEDGLPVYTIIINEKEFQKPAVELWITLIHELFGRVANTEMFGKLRSIEAEEARAYKTEVQVLDLALRYNNNMIQAAQQARLNEEDLQSLLQLLDIETLIEKKDKAGQQAEYYQRKADANSTVPGATQETAGPKLNYTPINRRQFVLGVLGAAGSLALLVLPGCKKETPSQPAASSSITVESQEAKESRIKAQIQALLQNSGENVDDDPMLNLAGSITHMLVDEAKFERLETLAAEGRLSFVRVAEKDMSTLYGLAQELNTVMEGFAYVNAFTFIAEDEDGLPVYTVIINEREFQKPPVELWVTLIHEVFGRVLNVEMSGRLGNLAAEEARAYETEAQVLDRVISNQDAVGQAVQQAWLSREDYELLLHTLNITTLKDKKNEAKQQAEYYQKQADADSITTGPGLDYKSRRNAPALQRSSTPVQVKSEKQAGPHSGDTLLISKGNRETRGNHTYFSVELMSPRVR